MKNRLLPSLILFAVLLAACAPAPGTPGPASPDENSNAIATPAANFVEETPSAPASDVATATAVSIEESPIPHPIATSRGPNLEATNPTTVDLASGQIQFVEFFQFW